MMIGSRDKKKRLTIGLLISNTSDVYTRLIWPGVAEELREKDANLIIFSGNPVFSGSSLLYRHYGQDFSQQPVSSFDYQSNIIYEMIDPESIDALILATGSLSHSGGNDEELSRFLARLGSIPMVSIAIPLEGIPSVLVDNKKGLQDAVDHLIDSHGYRRIAFIRGPENHREAQDRFQAYLNSLEGHGIAVDESIIYQGDFMWHSGMEAAKHLMETRGSRFDAVVAANDSMAISAMTYFQSRGVKVPGDVAVTGFDNIELAKYSFTPLSTVGQPFHWQARKAAEIAIDLASGRHTTDSVILPAEFIPRSSCGCLPEPVAINDARAETPAEKTSMVSIAKDSDPLPEKIGKLSALFGDLVADKTDLTAFLHAVNDAAMDRIRSGYEVRELVTTLTRIKNEVFSTLTGKEEILRCERYYQNAVIFLGEKASHVPGMKLIDYINSDALLVSVMHGILSKIQISELLDTITRELPRLNIPGCAISLYEKPWKHAVNDAWQVPEEIDLVMAYNREGRKEIGPERKRYRAAKLLPDGILSGDKSFTLIAEALYFAEEQLGLILFEMGNPEGMVYELLRLQISNAVKGSLMLHQQELIQKDLESHIQIMDSELDLARKIQFGLIPEKSLFPDISFYYKPMAKVGGDFFDFITFRNRDLTGIFISDVSGHGVPAALITSMIKTTLLQSASSSKSPSQVLRQLNKILLSQSGNNFITAFYGILNRKKRELEYSVAGHNLPLVITEKNVAPLPYTGKALPLAILDNMTLKDLRRDYVDQKIDLEPGSKLFLYTDGLTEAVNVREKEIQIGPSLRDFESSELFPVIEKYQKLPSRDFIDKITAKLRDFRGSEEYEDDVCVICVDIL